MLFISLLLATAATLAAAQSTTTTPSASTGTSTSSTSSAPKNTATCGAQEVLDVCLGTEQGIVNSCQSNDYTCLCSGYGLLVGCYASCPNDTGVSSAQQYQTQYCSAASSYGTTSVVAPVPSVTYPSTTQSYPATTTAAPSSASASKTAAAASASTSSGAAAHIAVDVLGFLAAGAVFFL